MRNVHKYTATVDREIGILTLLEVHFISGVAVSDAGRRRAFTLSCIMVVGQETCGVLALMQFAERVFVLARGAGGEGAAGAAGGAGGEPARHAVWLGCAQLLASALALYLVERVGRKVRIFHNIFYLKIQ